MGKCTTQQTLDHAALEQAQHQSLDPQQTFGCELQPYGNAAQAADRDSNEPTQPAEHIVVAGDTLWGIANTHLGNGRRYSEIVALNTEKDLEPLPIGVHLRLPAVNEASAGQIDLKENMENHPAGQLLTGVMVVAVVRAIMLGQPIGDAMVRAGGDAITNLDDANFAAVLNALQAIGWLDAFVGAMTEADRDALMARADVAATVPVTIFHGADAGTIDGDFAKANEVFNPHGISVEKGNIVTLDEAQTQAVLGADGELDYPTEREADGRRRMTAEANAMLATNRTGGAATGYWIEAFDGRPSQRGWAAGKYASDIMNEGVVMPNRRAVDSFAHELGHIFTQDGHEAESDNLMASGGHRNVGVDDLTEEQVEAIKQSVYTLFRG